MSPAAPRSDTGAGLTTERDLRAAGSPASGHRRIAESARMGAGRVMVASAPR